MVNDNIIKDYQARWEKLATVRTRPRRQLNIAETNGYYFPLAKQPLCSHPKVSVLGKEAIDYVLIQSLYKYSNDIAVTETQIVNQTTLRIASNQLPICFDYHYRINALTVIVDEGYHAYVAMDCLKQIFDHTNIEPLPLPEMIELSRAIKKTKATLDEKYHTCFELIAICIAENTLTKEIVTMKDKEETNDFFQNIIKDHLSDEGRHSAFFNEVLKKSWGEFSEEFKNRIGSILPFFLKAYLGTSTQLEFDKQILENLGFSEQQAQAISAETYEGFTVTKHHPMVKNIVALLERAGVTSHSFTRTKFVDVGLI